MDRIQLQRLASQMDRLKSVNLNSECEEKVKELRKQRDILQDQVSAIQKQIDEFYIAEMNPPFKKGDYIKITPDEDDGRFIYMLIISEPYRLNNGVRINGSEVIIDYNDKNNIESVLYSNEMSRIIFVNDFKNVYVISEDEFNSAIDTAFDVLRNDIIKVKENI